MNIPKAAMDAAWDLVEQLTFARDSSIPKMTLTALAKEIGVSMTALKAWEHGEYQPGLAAFVAWADIQGFDVVLRERED